MTQQRASNPKVQRAQSEHLDHRSGSPCSAVASVLLLFARGTQARVLRRIFANPRNQALLSAESNASDKLGVGETPIRT